MLQINAFKTFYTLFCFKQRGSLGEKANEFINSAKTADTGLQIPIRFNEKSELSNTISSHSLDKNKN